MGPSPDFTSWPYTNACYITWPGGYIDGMNASIHYEEECNRIPGHLFFSGDHGSNQNTCVFSAPSGGLEPREAGSRPPDASTYTPDVNARVLFDAGKYQQAADGFQDAASFWGKTVGSDDRDLARTSELRHDLSICMIYVSLGMMSHQEGRPLPAADITQADRECAEAVGVYSYAKAALARLHGVYDAQRAAEPPAPLPAEPPAPLPAEPEMMALPEWQNRFPPKNFCENEIAASRGQPYVGHCSAVLIGSVENYSGFNPGPWDEKGDPDWRFLKKFWRTGRQFYFYTDMCDVGSDEMAARSKAQITATTHLNKLSRAWDQDLRSGKFRPSLGFKGDKIISHCYAYKGQDTSLPGENPD